MKWKNCLKSKHIKDPRDPYWHAGFLMKSFKCFSVINKGDAQIDGNKEKRGGNV
ncbi:hypothetical protein HBHAL_2318 [Halobacillus halophilus DSM 2266]|uniref:Uncharacterized protein n=1 Tax=Halobacillus halophilus (strain ATCC 35676 / DSM 2266 / JCM 20832 / KCTC 3685 / LMG 17431 / NBRC 102448 / NCIMB 2269) TaxID=866895 RepID=I0JKJ6_HALH3|nr:hypothetical protein HBHAL_2318 [Halobacillus halophilus DSM 2266]